jgi:hypothetical protein
MAKGYPRKRVPRKRVPRKRVPPNGSLGATDPEVYAGSLTRTKVYQTRSGLDTPERNARLLPVARDTLIPEPLRRAAETVAREFAETLTTPMTAQRERYLRELVAVTRAAAVGGEYGDAIKGYEMIGKALGHISDKALHVHQHTHSGGELAERSDAELLEVLRRPILPPAAPDAAPVAITAQAQPAPAPTPAAQDAEALLFGPAPGGSAVPVHA